MGIEVLGISLVTNMAAGVPSLGQDTADVLQSWLKIDAAGLAALKSEGAL